MASVLCVLQDILEAIQNDQDVTADYELVCNSDTNVFDQVTTVIVDGVLGEPVITPTTIPCDPTVDYETERECRDGFVWIVAYADGVETGAVQTPESCDNFLEQFATECPDDCATGSTYIFGRPPASNAWSWGPYSGANLNEFEAALTAAGYNVLLFGEKHQICPPFGAFGEDPNALVDNGISQFEATIEPNIDPNYVSDAKPALQTSGCLDQDILDAINQSNALLEQLVSCLCECPDPAVCESLSSGSATAASGGVSVFAGASAVDGTGIKISDLDAGLAAAINDSIANGTELVIDVAGVGVFAARNITGAGPYAAGDTASVQGDASECGTVGVNGDGTWTSLTWETLA